MIPFSGFFNSHPSPTAGPAVTDWANLTYSYGTASSNITSQQLASAITLKVVNLTNPSAIQLFYSISATEVTGSQFGLPFSPPWDPVAASPGSTFAVSAGQWVSFTCYSDSIATIAPQTVEVRNNADNALIDTFTIQVTA